MTAPRILLVERDIVIRTPLATYLRECGFKVIEVFDVEEARKLLKQDHFSADIIFVDAKLHMENAFTFASWVRAHDPAIDVVLGGTVTHMARQASDLCDEGEKVCKPYAHEQLADEIRRRLALRAVRASPKSVC